jgi:ABC-2 type transport system ATP-binding protein
MIEFEDVARSYGKKLAVAGLSLTIGRGELFALLGPNGAGKTTSIKMLVGLLRPDRGSVHVCGHDIVAHTREATRQVGYVPDEPFLYDKLSGREMLEFVSDMRGLDRPLIQSRIQRESQRFEMDSFLDDLIETYSHGMRQRLVFASALLHDPAVLVVDEPMVGLDPRSMRLVKDLLRERAAAGATVFMSTHTLSVAEEIADRIGIVEQGRLVFLGTVGQLQRELSAQTASLEHLFLQLTEGNHNHRGQPGTGILPLTERSPEPRVPSPEP